MSSEEPDGVPPVVGRVLGLAVVGVVLAAGVMGVAVILAAGAVVAAGPEAAAVTWMTPFMPC